MIAAIVLAAGRSSRMGRPKALLPIGADTFLSRIARTLTEGGAERIVVVLGEHADEIRAASPITTAVTFVKNPRPELGQLSSLRTGLDALDDPQVDGAIVTLVDLPLITTDTVRAMIAAHHQGDRPPIVRATYHGSHGHPVLFDRRLFEELHAADPAIGARDVVHRHRPAIVDVEVDDPGVVEDVDSPEDYQRLIAATDHIRKM